MKIGLITNPELQKYDNISKIIWNGGEEDLMANAGYSGYLKEREKKICVEKRDPDFRLMKSETRSDYHVELLKNKPSEQKFIKSGFAQMHF